MRIETEEYLDFSQVLLKPKRSTLTSRADVNVTRDYTFKYCKIGDSLSPIIASNMSSVGSMAAARVLNDYDMLTALHKFYSKEKLVQFYLSLIRPRKEFFTIGLRNEDVTKYNFVADSVGYKPNICIDIANGYSEKFVKYVSEAREYLGDEAILMVGNVATPEITEELILNGADIVKVGIGSGAMCTTRSVTGVGIPQFTAAAECSDAAHGVGGMICSDGGITCPGDMVKALGTGADFVMLGTEFAAHDENTHNDDFECATVYGMSSSHAMGLHYTEQKDYRSSEGRVASIKKRGPLESTIKYYLGGLRSGMTYIGANKVEEIPDRATFIKVSKILNENYSQDTVRIR